MRKAEEAIRLGGNRDQKKIGGAFPLRLPLPFSLNSRELCLFTLVASSSILSVLRSLAWSRFSLLLLLLYLISPLRSISLAYLHLSPNLPQTTVFIDHPPFASLQAKQHPSRVRRQAACALSARTTMIASVSSVSIGLPRFNPMTNGRFWIRRSIHFTRTTTVRSYATMSKATTFKAEHTGSLVCLPSLLLCARLPGC
jgi:hypothetical protein